MKNINRIMVTYTLEISSMVATCLLLFALVTLQGRSEAETIKKELPIAPHVNVSRLYGEWDVVARIPTIFDKTATDMTVNLKDHHTGKIYGHWSFKKNANSEQFTKYDFSIKAGQGSESTKWLLSLFWFFRLEVQVVEFSGDMKWIILASKDYRYLWILSRGGALDSNLMKSLLDRVKALGFDMNSIVPR